MGKFVRILQHQVEQSNQNILPELLHQLDSTDPSGSLPWAGQ